MINHHNYKNNYDNIFIVIYHVLIKISTSSFLHLFFTCACLKFMVFHFSIKSLNKLRWKPQILCFIPILSMVSGVNEENQPQPLFISLCRLRHIHRGLELAEAMLEKHHPWPLQGTYKTKQKIPYNCQHLAILV